MARISRVFLFCAKITEEALERGLPFDGSSIPLLAPVEKSDMILVLGRMLFACGTHGNSASFDL